MKKNLKCIGALGLSLTMAVSLLPSDFSKAYTPGNYSYFDEYTLGYSGGVVAYQNGRKTSLKNAGVTVYDKKDDNVFASEIVQNWDDDVITLTQPVKYTTPDGTAHDVESMLTNFNFVADPTAIDNSDIDGKLYVYGTTEGFSYKGDILDQNAYKNHSLTIMSTEDMVNWTDEGFMDSANLTNEPSDSDDIVKGKFTSGQSWAPSGLKYDYDGDGVYTYYLFYTNGGAVGYVMGDSPMGPWKDPLGKALFTQQSPNCKGVVWCFDPAVLVDDKGDAYVYFGGGTTDNKAHGKTGRVCKIGFDKTTGEVYMDGEPQVMDTYYLFEDSEINQFNGLYYYSYCANFDVPGSDKWTKSGSIAVYVSSDPMDISFDPAGDEGDKYTDENDVYHHYLGTVLDNPSTIYGESYNNHHHMQSFKGKNYIFYHSTVLNNTLHRYNKQYRCLHVDEIEVDKDTDEISIEPSYEGASQIENFNPYKDFKGEDKVINATTTSYSAGVNSRRSDERVRNELSPMVLDNIDTGDWTKIQGVDFGNGAVKFEAEIGSETEDGAIEVFLDDPTSAANLVASVRVKDTGSKENFETVSTDIKANVSGVHDVYFVFRGTDYNVASWKFTEKEVVPTAVPTQAPTKAPAVTPTQAPTQAPVATPTQAPAKNKIMKLSSVKCTKNSTKVTGKVSVSGTTVKVKVGSKAYKKASVKGKKFTAKVAKLKKKAKVTIKVTKKGYKTLIKTFKVK